MTQSGVVSGLSSVLPTSQVFTSGYVNTETILHFFYKITNKGNENRVYICSYKMVLWPIREHVLFELFYKCGQHTVSMTAGV